MFGAKESGMHALAFARAGVHQEACGRPKYLEHTAMILYLLDKVKVLNTQSVRQARLFLRINVLYFVYKSRSHSSDTVKLR